MKKIVMAVTAAMALAACSRRASRQPRRRLLLPWRRPRRQPATQPATVTASTLSLRQTASRDRAPHRDAAPGRRGPGSGRHRRLGTCHGRRQRRLRGEEVPAHIRGEVSSKATARTESIGFDDGRRAYGGPSISPDRAAPSRAPAAAREASAQHLPAVDDDGLTGDPARQRRGEEEHDFGHFLRFTEPPERNAVQDRAIERRVVRAAPLPGAARELDRTGATQLARMRLAASTAAWLAV